MSQPAEPVAPHRAHISTARLVLGIYGIGFCVAVMAYGTYVALTASDPSANRERPAATTLERP